MPAVAPGSAPVPPPPPLPDGPFDGREAFRALVRAALAEAAARGWGELVLSDADFADWPLGERAVVQSLHDWARAGRRCTLLAQDFSELARSQPRFVQWRRQWDHLVTARRAATTDALAVPSALWSPAWVLQRHDPVRSHGSTGTAPERRVLLRQALDEWLLRQSSPAFAASTLGL